MKRSFTVIGLGVFGSTLAMELARLGHDVIGIDLDPDVVAEVADHISQAVVADARDEHALRELGVQDCDVAVVSIGEDMEANLLATLIVKGMGKPKVWAEALNHRHEQILRKMGADHVVHPEQEMGLRLAHSLVYPGVEDYISLGGEQFVVEIRVSPRLAEQTLRGLDLESLGLRCLLIKHGTDILQPPPEDHAFRSGEQLVLLGALSNLQKMTRFL